jgi:ubiquinone/menaquinone biosynthesis C-methylase UbiE
MQGLEPVFQQLRIWKVWPHIPQGTVLVDLGCDYEQTLLKRMQARMKKVIGLDVVVKNQRRGNVSLQYADLTKKLPLPAQTADVVTMLAVLEHLKGPEKILKEVYRILKPGGVLLVTVPSANSRPILNFLAPMGLVRQEMIDQHENYFTHDHLKKITRQAGFKKVSIESWELGCNTFMKATK